MLTKKMEKALNGQVNAELYSSYLYLSMAAWLDTRKLPGFVHWMKTQALEELYHGIKLFDYVRAAGGRAVLPAIAAPEQTWKSPLQVAEEILAHEKKVTGLIHALVAVAKSEKDARTARFLAWYVKEQVEEEESAQEVIDQVKAAGRSLKKVDAVLHGRKFKIPRDIELKFKNATIINP